MIHPNIPMAEAYVTELCGSKPKIGTFGEGHATFELTPTQFQQAAAKVRRFFGEYHIESWTERCKDKSTFTEYDEWNIADVDADESMRGCSISLQVDIIKNERTATAVRTISLMDKRTQ